MAVGKKGVFSRYSHVQLVPELNLKDMMQIFSKFNNKTHFVQNLFKVFYMKPI